MRYSAGEIGLSMGWDDMSAEVSISRNTTKYLLLVIIVAIF